MGFGEAVMNQYSHKKESRMRTPDGVKSLPSDLHAALNEEKTASDYETLWATAIHAMRLGLRIMQAQHDRATEIINNTGALGNIRSTGGNVR
jgi:hypothetical protein